MNPLDTLPKSLWWTPPTLKNFWINSPQTPKVYKDKQNKTNQLTSIQNALPYHSWWQQSSTTKGFGGSFWTELYVPSKKFEAVIRSEQSPKVHKNQQNKIIQFKVNKKRKFSYAQETRAMEYLTEPFAALEEMCNEPKLRVHAILIISAEMMEMFEFIPSISEFGKTVDMRESDLTTAIHGMADKLDGFLNDPLSVTQEMIQIDAIKIADHAYG